MSGYELPCLSACACGSLTQIGDAFYDERRQAAWAQVKRVGQDQTSELWFGYRQSIVMTDQVRQSRALMKGLPPCGRLCAVVFATGRLSQSYEL